MSTLGRRSFRFSLRTMFLGLLLLALPLGWLAWQLQIVRERKAILAEIVRMNDPYGNSYTGLESTDERNRIAGFRTAPNRDPFMRVSTIRRWLGDESCQRINLSESVNPQLIERTENAFPEAELYIGFHAAYRDSLYRPQAERSKNWGTIFKTGLIEK